ncbi:hypothetical protein OF377_00120 [Ureaplasma sp. ES3154-GEN]|uniref:hypothetical protein n=1 Tax=Ureaplasma sp. ES3154-GEN TaxID=2984844 RepID=UPI0021E8BD85|nr:hypothetical protein [Ureaplasma sp. ES3154-GEN]MCV3743293.1 hypothetical protein [Ureaplasma sp. ES3154-GEN]
MKLLNEKEKTNLTGGYGASYLWNTAIITGMLGQNLAGSIGLIAQLVQTLNPNPKYSRTQLLDNTAARMYARIAQHPSKATMSFGSPFF